MLWYERMKTIPLVLYGNFSAPLLYLSKLMKWLPRPLYFWSRTAFWKWTRDVIAHCSSNGPVLIIESYIFQLVLFFNINIAFLFTHISQFSRWCKLNLTPARLLQCHRPQYRLATLRMVTNHIPSFESNENETKSLWTPLVNVCGRIWFIDAYHIFQSLNREFDARNLEEVLGCFNMLKPLRMMPGTMRTDRRISRFRPSSHKVWIMLLISLIHGHRTKYLN